MPKRDLIRTLSDEEAGEHLHRLESGKMIDKRPA
jgi:hypothetical protein